jgi:hypothetical protein
MLAAVLKEGNKMMVTDTAYILIELGHASTCVSTHGEAAWESGGGRR